MYATQPTRVAKAGISRVDSGPAIHASDPLATEFDGLWKNCLRLQSVGAPELKSRWSATLRKGDSGTSGIPIAKVLAITA